MLVSTALRLGDIMYLILMLEICIITVIVKGHVCEAHLFSSNVEHCCISNVNSYQCSCKQCCPIAVYAMCYSLINPCGYWT